MATNKPLQTILNDLPDNNAKEITPADVRQIATSSFSPQLVLAGCQSLDTDTSGFTPDERAVYGCNYYNPYFFAPQADTKVGLSNPDQIWQITSYGSGLTAGTYTAICTANPISGFNFAPTTNGVWEVVIDSLGQIESFKIISPAQGWQSGSLPGTFPGRFEQTGYLDISGNQTIEVRFNGPLRAQLSSAVNNVSGEYAYVMTTNTNPSDQSTAFPGQGSQDAADFTTANTSANIALFGVFTGADNLGIRVGRWETGGSWTNIDNWLQIKTDVSRAVQFQIWRTPGGNF